MAKILIDESFANIVGQTTVALPLTYVRTGKIAFGIRAKIILEREFLGAEIEIHGIPLPNQLTNKTTWKPSAPSCIT